MTIATMNNIQIACVRLTAFVIHKADEIQKKIGFGYADVSNAPSDFDELKVAFNASKSSGLALPIWNGASDNTIYTSIGGNYAFRFWHDVLHCLTDKGFDTASEISIGAMHVKAVQDEFGAHSLEALLMYADTIGQSLYAASRRGELPSNQLEWVTQEVKTYIERLNSEAQFAAIELPVLEAA